ncbi:MAG: carbohydrate kinase family protein, partial [Chitinophagales bacterium]
MNNTTMIPSFDILAVGELLIDLIGKNKANSLQDTIDFERFQGGSPANFARNMSKLGNRVKLVASIGEDGMGHFLQSQIASLEINCSDVKMRSSFPTTIITVAKTDGTPDFQAYRGADAEILADQLKPQILQQTRVFHTTCFALSKNPARESIMDAAQIAVNHGCQLSIDLNYSPKIWVNQAKAQNIIATYCSYGALVKLSKDDWNRTYQQPDASPETVIEFIHNLGAKEVCFTLGSEGSYVSKDNKTTFIESRKIDVVDATGAGDAFWSGYLTAWLDGHKPKTCA